MSADFISAGKKFFSGLLFFLLLCGSCPALAQALSTPVPAAYQEFLYQGRISIKYRELYQGHPYTLLFIHGYGAASHYWRELEEHFAGRYNTVALDLKGFGYSAKPKDGNYRVRDQADLVQAFIQAKNLSNVILVGHSLGGAVALLTSFQLPPEKVKGLILLDNASYAQKLPDFVQLMRTPVLNTVGPALLPDRLLVKQMLKKVFSDQTKITEAMIRQYTTYLKSPGAYYALRQTAKQIIPANVDEIIDQTVNLKIPVLIIWGEDDRILPLESGQRLHEDIKNSELVIIPGSGHDPHEEKPAETIQAITDFLDRHLQPGLAKSSSLTTYGNDR
jgi:pimeloyl-ACP methyl ester carboxylesterase